MLQLLQSSHSLRVTALFFKEYLMSDDRAVSYTSDNLPPLSEESQKFLEEIKK
jgi:hypothetical protein